MKADIDRTILETARSVFEDLGFADAQMEVIAERSRVSKAALYRRYANKTALLVSLVDKLLVHTIEKEIKSLDISDHTIDRLRDVIMIYRNLQKTPDQLLLRRLIVSSLKRCDELGQVLDTARIAYTRPIDDILTTLTADGLLRSDIPCVSLREILFDLFVNEIGTRLLLGQALDKDDFQLRWQLAMELMLPKP